jgi:hypothetical protein
VYRGHVLGNVVRTLRAMRASGSTVRELEAFVVARGVVANDCSEYLSYAFCGTGRFSNRIRAFIELDRDATDQSSPGKRAEELIGPIIDRDRETWEKIRFPELMRLRDYAAFLTFAREERCKVIVCGANPHSGRLIAAPGYRCYDGSLFVISREKPPHEGQVAADPDDPRLCAALGAYAPPLSYDEYVTRLRREGYSVLGREAGFVLEDAQGFRIHDGYRLHGVYNQENESAWTGKEGDRLRRSLNRHLGHELVRWGPHDDWQYRNDREIAGPLWGPLPPIMNFLPDGTIENYLTTRAMTSNCRFYEQRWSHLYPHHPTVRA